MEEKRPELYEKDKGSAQIHGQIFEYKFCALVFLRATNKGYKFKLASNVKGLGAFDDVFVEYIDESCEMSHKFVQLKSKTKQRLTKQQLLTEKGDFSLRKYYQSYVQIEGKFNCSEEGVKLDGRIDESLFIIYTNADVGQELKPNEILEGGEEEFLMTGGTVLQFNEEDHKAIYEHLQELPRHREFLSRLRIFYSQADEKGMDWYIKRELQQSMKLPDNELDLAYVSYRDFIKDWWQNCNYFLQDNNCKETDPLRKTSENIRTTLAAKILDQRKSELDDLRIKYKQYAIADMEQLIEHHKAVLIFAPGRSTTLTAAKIHQMLCATKHIILNLQQLIRYKSEVMLAWERSFNVLVLESDSSAEVSPDLFNELPGYLNNSVAEKKLIFILNSVSNLEQIHEIRRTFNSNLTEEYEDFKFTDILTESRMFFLDKKVYFQGVEVKLSTIIQSEDVRMLNRLDCDSVSIVLENKKPSIGTPVKDTVECYIDRTLRCRKHAKTRSPSKGKLQRDLSRNILQEVRDIISHKEENLGRGTATVWKPSTLFECEDRFILVTDEPGMGKSTLLTHLAKESRKRQPDKWIVRININSHTRILNELKTNGCDQKGAIKLLTEAAQIKETDGVVLEGRLFNYTYNSTGNMAVLIDGVDEVSPHYTEQVVEVLKILSKTKIKKIWLTSRNSVKDRLEEEFECQAFSLVPFSEEDQKRYLVAFWKRACPEKKHDYLENLANRVVKLSTEHLTVQDKKFMGIPLQSLLLAEMFVGNLKECSTSTNVELPEHINIVVLFYLYMEKKWDIYLSEKKLSERTNVNVLSDDDDALHKTFIHNHTAAALVSILSTHQMQKLADKTIAEKARDFIQKITEGMEKTGIIIDVIEERPVFQHRTLAEYLVARWLCDNLQTSQTFMKDHLFESGFDVVRIMVDRILADGSPVHEAVLNSNLFHVEKLLQKKESITQKDCGGRMPLHLAVSCRNQELIKLLLENEADVSSVDTLLGLSPVDYASRMNDWEMLSLMMEKRPDIREQVLSGTNRDGTNSIACVLRTAAHCGYNDLLKYLISKGNSVNLVLPGDNSTLLHVAARNQRTETVKILLLQGAIVDSQDESGKTPLHVSAETGNIEAIKYIVEHQETVQSENELQHVVNPERTIKRRNFLNVPDIDGNTPLHLGVAAGNTNIVSYLVSAGSESNICNVQGNNPLTLAARCGKNDIVELLMNSGVESNEAQIGALRAAIVAGHVDTMTLLLRLGVPVNIGDKEMPIHVASRLGRKEMFILLLQYGASLTSLTDTGDTALHLASEAGHLNLVKYLVELDRGRMYSLNLENETPLHLAVRNGKDYLVTYYTESGCNINDASANGATCLHIACENGHYTTVECLLKHGAEVNAVNSAHQTPLHVAASRGQTKIVELLFLHNAKFSLRDKDGFTALLSASINGHQDTVLFIVQHGGSIEDADGKGNTIAHFAVENENIDILKFLSKQGANLEIQNPDGDTPLFKAVREGRKSVVQYLAKRCDINTEGNDGMRPLDVAILKGNSEISHLLLEQNARSGKSGMHIVEAARLGFLDSLHRFLDMGDDVNMKTDNGESPLHSACKSGQVATVQYLCEHGALLGLKDNKGNTALHVAVSNDRIKVTRVLVEKGANLCAADASGSTALHIAAKGGYLDIVQYLTDNFAPIDFRNAKNETALLEAVSEGHEKIVRVLIELGAGIGVRNAEGKTAFNIATEKGYEVITQLLKGRGEGRILLSSSCHTDTHTAADEGSFDHWQRSLNAGVSVATETEKINTDTPRMMETTPENTLGIQSKHRFALHTAAKNNNFEQVQRLVKFGLALDCVDSFGRTPLWVAAKSGHKSIIRFLLQNGSCVNIPDYEGIAPIEIAAREGHWEAFEVFLVHDPLIRPECTVYLTEQLYRASESGDLQIVQTILNCGITVERNTIFGCTPLHVSAEFGHKNISRMFLNFGANVEEKDDFGSTPLVLSATNGHTEVVRELLHHGASVDIRNNFGESPLFAAAKKGHVEVVRALLNYGASVNIEDKYGYSPLFEAAKLGHVEVVRVLLDYGANVNIEDENGYTPVFSAAKKGYDEVVQLLLDHGAKVDNTNAYFRTIFSATVSKKTRESDQLIR